MAWLLMTMLVSPVSGECCHEKKTNRETKMPVFYVVCNHFRFEIIFVSITIKFSVLSFSFVFRFRFTNHFRFRFRFR